MNTILLRPDPLTRFRLLIIFGLAVLAWAAIMGGLSMVLAQDADGIVVTVPPTTVVFEWGDWLAILLAELAKPDSVAWTIFGLAAAFVVARLPAPLQWAWRLFQVEQLLAKSLNAGINATSGAVAGQRLQADVGNEVLAKALQYAVDNGSAAAIKWAGGDAALRNKLLARMELDAKAAIPLVAQ